MHTYILFLWIYNACATTVFVTQAQGELYPWTRDPSKYRKYYSLLLISPLRTNTLLPVCFIWNYSFSTL